jgi:hypothetical protein
MNIAKYLEEARKPAPKKLPAEKKLSPFLMDFIRHTMESNKGKVLHSLGKVEWDSYARDYAEDYPGDPHGLAARLEEVFWGEQDLRDTMIRDLLASPGVEGRMISALDALVGHHAQIEDDNFEVSIIVEGNAYDAVEDFQCCLPHPNPRSAREDVIEHLVEYMQFI